MKSVYNKLKYLIVVLIFINTVYGQNTLTKVKLQLKWKHQFQDAGYIAAVEKGFYKDVGLDVSLLEFNADTKVLDSIKSNKVQFAISDTSIILNRIKGEPIKAVMATFQKSPHILLGLKSPNIHSINDLNGKKIALVDELNGLELSAMLKSNNINFIRKPAIFTFDKFFSKEIDFMSAYISNEPFIAKEKGIDVVTFFPGDYGYDGYGDILFTSDYMIQTNPKLVQKMYEASIKGWEYAYEHKEEIVDIIYNKYNTLKKSKKALLYEAVILQKLSGYDDNLGNLNLDKIKSIGRLFDFLINGKYNLDNLNNFIYKPDSNNLYLTDKEKEFLKKHPMITLGTGDNWSPYSIKKRDGSIVGLDIDIINKINKLTGAYFVLKLGNWEQMQKLAKENKVDGLCTLIKTKEREKFLNFSDIYFSLQKMVLVKQRNPLNIKSPSDLDGKTIVIAKGNIADENEAKKFKNAKIIYADTTIDMVKEVIYGKADATFGNGALEYMLIQDGLPYLENAFALNQHLNLRFAVKKEWHEAISIINKALHHIGEQELMQIKQKWFSSNTTINKYESLILTKDESDYLSSKKTIKMCTDPNWMPFEKIENGKYIGMGADYIKLINQKLPLTIELVQTQTWSESLDYIKQKKCDILPLAMKTKEREEFLNFTTPYITVPIVLATKPNIPFITDFTTLKDKKIAIPKNYALVDILKCKYPNFNIVEGDDIYDGLNKVYNKELFGYVGPLASIAYQFQNNFASGLKIAAKFDNKFELSIATAKDQPILNNIFQKALNSINDDQKRDILNKWIAINYKKDVNYKFIWKIIVISFVILLIIFYWNIRLKKEISKRKLAEQKLQLLNNNLEIKILDAVKDVQEKEKLLQQQSKLASMGEMIGNIAHQWRQPLAVSNTIVSILKEKSNKNILDKNYIQKKLDEIESANLYMSQTIEDFLSFFNPSKEKEKFNVLNAVDKSISIVKHLITQKKINIDIDIDSNLQIIGLRDEYVQVIISILSNAIYALKNKQERRDISVLGYKENNMVILKITDNAGGIPNEIIDRVFEPYFTTKHKSKGTGLGLYISKMIIENSMDGKLNVYNTKDGVCFEIILISENIPY